MGIWRMQGSQPWAEPREEELSGGTSHTKGLKPERAFLFCVVSPSWKGTHMVGLGKREIRREGDGSMSLRNY